MIRSPASCRDCSTESTTMMSALATASSSSSRLCAWLAPMALMCAPGDRSVPFYNRLRGRCSCADDVRAADGLGRGCTCCTGIPAVRTSLCRTFRAWPHRARKRAPIPAFEPRQSASSCVLACPPVPMIAATRAFLRARYFVPHRRPRRSAVAHVIRFDQRE